MKLRLGIVSLGTKWESRYRPALRALTDRFEVRAVYSEVPAKAHQVAEEFRATPMSGIRAIAESPDIDALMMLSPSWFGAFPILAACDSGKAIYCAPALAIDPQRVGAVKQRVESAGISFAAEFPRRHSPATLRLKELIATRLGPPTLLFCHYRLKEPDAASNGSAAPALEPAHLFRMELLELVDWCRFVVGRAPSSVMGVIHQRSDESPDYQMMNLRFSQEGGSNGSPMAQISCGDYLAAEWPEARSFRPPAQLQVCCENGTAFVDLPTTLVWFDEAGRHMESLESDRPVGEQLLTQFHRSVTSLVRKTDDLEDAYRALQVVLAAEQSAREGRRICLDELS